MPNPLEPDSSGKPATPISGVKTCSDRLSGERFPKMLRLTGRDEFTMVFDQGRVEADRTLVVHAIRTERKYSRIGLSVSKKVGNSPQRNFWKRCIREAFRRQRCVLPVGLDIIVRPRRDARANSRAIAESLYRLLKKVDKQLRS